MSKRNFLGLFTGIFVLGLCIRLFIAYNFPGDYDMESWVLHTQSCLNGENVYAVSHRYHYAPILLWILHAFGIIAVKLNLPLYFGVKLSFITADVLIFTVLAIICQKLNLSKKEKLIIPALFFLNPVSIIITAYHGQFDNISLLFVLLALFVHSFYPKLNYLLTAFLFSISVAVKHFTLMLSLVFAFIYKRFWNKIGFLFISPLVFILTLLPHYLAMPERINKYVFGYNLGGGYWGWSGIICRSLLFLGIDLQKFPQFKYIGYFNYFLYFGIFAASFYLVKRFKLLDNIIIVFLMFYAFTTQIAPQYSIWLIPFGALRRNIYFYLYSIICTIHLVAFEYCHYHWYRKIPFVGIVSNSMSEVFVIFRHLLWVVCVLWLIYLLKTKKTYNTNNPQI